MNLYEENEMSDLYVNTFTLAMLRFKNAKKINIQNWYIEAVLPELNDMVYGFYFGSNPDNDRIVNDLKDGDKMVVNGTIKSSKSNNSIILRVRQIIHKNNTRFDD